MASDNPSILKRLIQTPAMSSTLLVLFLSLVTWYFFYMRSMPLSSGDIAAVVVLWLIVVIVGKWIVGHAQEKEHESEKKS
jgi:hypothetical protein